MFIDKSCTYEVLGQCDGTEYRMPQDPAHAHEVLGLSACNLQEVLVLSDVQEVESYKASCILIGVLVPSLYLLHVGSPEEG